MSKKNKDIKKTHNSEEENTDTSSNKAEEVVQEEPKTEQSAEEQLAIEKDKNLRLFAEFENFRRRTAKERIELFSTANMDIMTILLPILDNFERSIEANNYSDEDGPVLIYKQLKSELKKKGLSEMDDPKGKELDTDFHEAISNIPAPENKLKGKIIDVTEKGYLLGEKVLRYAKVVVGNKE
ncbi:MAG: nucleotide exchange factor GrpE [Flavobacteriales bacterium]|nr:nucleotide exchange factor GrpE [Flavobacteriales bacterium]|tara:strand:- start:1657 stop:2202 length:546 start_codon:yes stop_codon:yes gene_type:complete